MDEIFDIGNSYMCDCQQPGCSYCDQDGSLTQFQEKFVDKLMDKRKEQQRETWINNIVKVLGKTREEAVEMYNKIKPYEKDLDQNKKMV